MFQVVGKIIGFHGLKGELKVYPLVDEFQDFNELRINGNIYKLESFRYHKNLVLLKLSGIVDLTHAESIFKEKNIEIEAELRDLIWQGDDLKGMSLVDSSTELGLVTSFIDKPQALLVVKLNSNNRELLVPFVDEYIIEVDTAKGIIHACIPDDLLELAS